MKRVIEKNIMVLSMSTLNTLTESYYCTKDGKYSFCGISQLEPGTKLFLRALQMKGKKLDQIYIVESSKARTDTVDVSGIFGNGTFAEKGEEIPIRMNAVDFYKKRIEQYIQGKEEFHYSLPAYIKAENRDQILENITGLQEGILTFEDQMKSKEESGQGLKSLAELYPDIQDLFIDIELNDIAEIQEQISGESTAEDPADGSANENTPLYLSVNKLCNEVKAMIRAEEEKASRPWLKYLLNKSNFDSVTVKINLYIDMQGARRYETFIINAAIKMLEMCGAAVESSVACDYARDNNENGRYNTLMDTTMNDRIFEMVSGMNEFITTGRGETLHRFYEHSKGLINLNPQEVEIIKQIGEISDAISLCDVRKYDEALTTFSSALTTYKNQNDIQKQPLFMSFVDDLETDYRNYHLLTENAGRTRTIDQVEWCLSKKLYQQALTLIEAKMPEELVSNQIFYYGDKKQLCNLIDRLRAVGWSSIPVYMISKIDKKVKPENAALIFIKYLFAKDGKVDSEGLPRLNVANNFYGMKFEEQINQVTLKSGRNGHGKERIESEIIADFICQYEKLVKIRNEANHATEEERIIEDVEELEMIIRMFIKSYNDIIEYNNGKGIHIDYSEYRILLSGDIERGGDASTDEIKNGEDTSSGDIESEEDTLYGDTVGDELTVEEIKAKADETFRQLPVEKGDGRQLDEVLKEIWQDNGKAIADFKIINRAILQMDGLTIGEFMRGRNTKYAVLRQLLDTLIAQQILKSNEKPGTEGYYKNRFYTLRGRNPYDRFKNAVKDIRDFYPDQFVRP